MKSRKIRNPAEGGNVRNVIGAKRRKIKSILSAVLSRKDGSERPSLPPPAVVGRVWLSAPELDADPRRPRNMGDAGNVVPTAWAVGSLAFYGLAFSLCFQRLFNLAQGKTVDHIGLREPAFAGESGSEPEMLEAGDMVSVGVDGAFHPLFAG